MHTLDSTVVRQVCEDFTSGIHLLLSMDSAPPLHPWSTEVTKYTQFRLDFIENQKLAVCKIDVGVMHKQELYRTTNYQNSKNIY